MIAACARGDGGASVRIARAGATSRRRTAREGGTLLAEFAGDANTDGIRLLLALGVKINALYEEGNRTSTLRGTARLSTSRHGVPAGTVKFLIQKAEPRRRSWMERDARLSRWRFVRVSIRIGRIGVRPNLFRRYSMREPPSVASFIHRGTKPLTSSFEPAAEFVRRSREPV